MQPTEERIDPEKYSTVEQYVLYLKHLFAYEYAKSQMSPDDIVLEVGCGEGYGASILASNYNVVEAIDVDNEVISRAGEKYGNEYCKYRLYDGEKIPYHDNRFDMVVTFQVIEHVKSDTLFLKEIYRVMKPGAKLLIATPNRSYRLRPFQKPWNSFHLREYSASQFEKAIEKVFSDFEVCGVSATETLRKIEVDRVLPSKRPKILKNIIRQIRKLTKEKKESERFHLNDAVKLFNINDFYIEKKHVNRTLDLFAICKK